MEKETFTFKEIGEYLKDIANRFDTGGIWVAKKFGKRWAYIVGEKSQKALCPSKYSIGEEYALFIEDDTRVKREINDILKHLEELLYEKRT